MALPTITKMQKTAQEMLNKNKQQQAASTTAVQSGSTSTPTTTETPKVDNIPKTIQSQPVQQTGVGKTTQTSQVADLSKINLFKPQEQIKTAQDIKEQYGDKLVAKQEEEKELNLFQKIDKASKGASDKITDWINEETSLFDISDLTVEKVKSKDVTGGQLAKLFGKGAWYGIVNWSADTQKTLLNWGTEYVQDKLEKLGRVMDAMGLDSSGIQQGVVSLDEFRDNMFDRFDKTLEYLDKKYYVSQYTNNGISLQSTLRNGDIAGVFSLLGNQFGSMAPTLAAGIVTRGRGTLAQTLSMFATNFPSMTNETMEMLLADDTIDASYETKLKAATAAGTLKSIIESLDTLFEFFTGGKVKPVKKAVMNTIIKKKIASIASEMGEEMLQYEIDELVAKMLGSERDRTSFASLVQDVGFEAAVYAIFFPTGAIEGINQKKINETYKEVEKQVKEDVPSASTKQVEKIAEVIIENAYNGNIEEKKINEYHKQAEELYNQKSDLESKLEATTDPWTKQTINNQIKDIETKINDIDEKVNKIQTVDDKIKDILKTDIPTKEDIEQYVKQSYENMEKSPSELSARTAATYKDTEQNLSKQTMAYRESEPNKQKVLNNLQTKQLDTYRDVEKFVAWTSKLNKMNTKQSNNELSKYDDESLRRLRTIMNNVINSGGTETFSLDMARNVVSKIDAAEEYIKLLKMNKAIQEQEQTQQREDRAKKHDYKSFDEFVSDMTHIADNHNMTNEEMERVKKYGKRDKNRKIIKRLGKVVRDKEELAIEFTKQKIESEISHHLAGVDDVDIRELEDSLTPEQVQEVKEMFAMVSTTLGIDFNLVTKGRSFGMSLTSKDMPGGEAGLRGLAIWDKSDVTGDLKNLGIILTLKEGKTQAASTLAHEMGHILDFAYNFDAAMYGDGEFSDPTYIKGGKEYVHSLLESIFTGEVMPKRETYNHAIKQKARGLKLDEYWNIPSEVFARYTEQYMAFVNDKELFDKYTKEDRFWSEEEFKNLLDNYYDILDNQLADYRMSEKNSLYYDAMVMLNNARNGKLDLLNRTEEIERIAKQYPGQTNRILNEIYVIEKQYLQALRMVYDLEGNIKEDMLKVYSTELSLLESNFKLLIAMEEKYIEIQRNTIQQQLEMDLLADEISDNGQDIISEIEDNQQEGDIIDDAMESEMESEMEGEGIEETTEVAETTTETTEETTEETGEQAEQTKPTEPAQPTQPEPLDVAVSNVVDNVINSSNKVIDKTVKEKSVNEQKKAKEEKKAIREIGQGIKDVFTPALSRLYNISPRLAGAVHVYQASVGLKTLGYKKLTENFVKAMDKLRKKNPEAYRKLSLALFDWGMDESIDIKQSLKEAGLDEKLFEPVVSILNRIATEYKEAGLDITINDKYFPRKVKDYGLLLDYLSRKSGKDITGTKSGILNRITTINENPNLTDGEKEVQVHNLLINEFSKPSERSNNAKERKLVLSEWLLTEEEKQQGYKNDIIDFYEDPIVAFSNYIDDMVKKTELKKMLGGLTNDKTAISDKFDDSIAKIILDMENRGELTHEAAEEAKHVIKSIVNARATKPAAQKIKNATYAMTIANWLSAAQQLEDLSKTLLRGPTGFKNIIKSVIGKANINMDDTGLDNIFAELESGTSVTDLLFKLSGFDAVDALGKKSFINTARDSCVRQANSEKRSIILKTRLTQMYGERMGMEIFEAYKDNKLREEVKDEDGNIVKDENGKEKKGDIKLAVMVDLLYQLGNTQPIYKSAMPTAYLNNPKIRIAYCLWSFTVKQIDWVIQGTKEVYNNQILLGRSKSAAAAAATARCTGALLLVSTISALVQEFINWAKGDDDDLMFKKLKEEGFVEFLKQFGINSLAGLLKIFNISKYDNYIFKREGLAGVIMNKITPAPLGIMSDLAGVLIGKDKLSSIGKYSPLFLKPLYYQFKNHNMLPDYKLWGQTKTSETKTSGGSRYSGSGGSKYGGTSSGGSRYSK